MSLLLNCDLGESYGQWQMGQDAAIMPHIQQANIACGMHAGDPSTIRQTLELAQQHQVEIGAHPSYPDLSGFGRRSMKLPPQALKDIILYQIAALDGMAQSTGQPLAKAISYVKPHGALYNDMMASWDILETVAAAIKQYHRPLTLMLQAVPAVQQDPRLSQLGVEFYWEAFADRAYTDQGLLQPRTELGACLDLNASIEQAQRLKTKGEVVTASGNVLPLTANTLCIHGDSPDALALAKAL